jgi:CubicO group peptidase (beta-lactamase class C family)
VIKLFPSHPSSKTWFTISLILVAVLGLHSCHVGRFFYWNFADANDYKKFASVPVEKAPEPFHYSEANPKSAIPLPDTFQQVSNTKSLSGFLEENKTLAFLVIRNDSILYENYFEGYDESSVIPSFSVSKIFISALTGIAIQEGYLRSAKQSITDFLPELLESDSAFARITIAHLLNMRSGIRFNEGYANPFADMAKYYYGRHLQDYIKNLKIENPPGQNYEYISVNSLLLAMIIERSTGRQLNDYLAEKIWQPLGMEYDATWSIDSKAGNQIKAFCCLNARARDFAKLGSLYLNHGQWQGQQLVPKAWVEKSLSIINDSRDSQGYPYIYQWRVLPSGAAFAKGVLGQYIYIDPAKNIVIVRMGKKSGDVHWPKFFEELVDGV